MLPNLSRLDHLIVGFGAASGRHSMVMFPLTAPDKLCGKGFFVNEGANAEIK
jgi:hypothetical protein